MQRRYLLPVLGVVLLACGCRADVTSPVPLRLVSSELIEADAAERVYALRFEDPRGVAVDAYLRAPVRASEARRELYGAVLIAGRETGREAAAMIPGPLDGLVLGVEYLEELPERLDPRMLLRRLPAVRRVALRMPGVLLGATEFLAAHPAVDTMRLALVGVSFGVPFAVPAGRDRRYRGVALLYGGADLALLFRTHLPIENRLVRRAVARLLAWSFRELEPARHVGAISPTPLLLINGLSDTFVPRESVERLVGAARSPVRHIWLPRGHLMPWPEYSPLMRELADSTVRHFEILRVGANSAARPAARVGPYGLNPAVAAPRAPARFARSGRAAWTAPDR